MQKKGKNKLPRSYAELCARQEEERRAFPKFCAYDNEQLEDGMKKLGLSLSQKDLVETSSTGDIMKKSDVLRYKDMRRRHIGELRAAADTMGEGFILEMLELEGNKTGALGALGMTERELEKNPAFKHNLEKACEMAEKKKEKMR